MNHSRRPQPETLKTEPERLTWPRSAANTPSWQVSEDKTRIVVLTAAKGTLSFSVFCAHSSGLTDRIVKYDAKRAAKNISSLESQMIVPTLTMLGRSWCPWSREAGIVVEAVATAPLCPEPREVGTPPPRRGRHILVVVTPTVLLHVSGGGDALVRFSPGRVFATWDLLSPAALLILL